MEIHRIVRIKGSKPFALRLPPDTHEQLKRIARRDEASINLIINQAISDFLDKIVETNIAPNMRE